MGSKVDKLDADKFVYGKEICKFRADNNNVDFPTQFCLENISNKFGTIDSREVSCNVYDFSVDYNAVNKVKNNI